MNPVLQSSPNGTKPVFNSFPEGTKPRPTQLFILHANSKKKANAIVSFTSQ